MQSKLKNLLALFAVLLFTLGMGAARAQVSYSIPQGNTQGVAGQDTAITVQVTNTSGSTLSFATAIVNLPADWAVTGINATGWTCMPAATGSWYSCNYSGSVSIAPGASSNITVMLRPGSAAVGGVRTFYVTDDLYIGLPTGCAVNGGLSSFCSSITLNASSPASTSNALTVCSSSSPLAPFGTVWVNDTASQTLCLTNAADAAINLNSLQASSSAFRLSGCASIASGEECELDITFAPTADVDYTAGFEIRIDFGALEGLPAYSDYRRVYTWDTQLTGSGLQLNVQAPSVLNFSDTGVGSMSCLVPFTAQFSTRLPAPRPSPIDWETVGPFALVGVNNCGEYAQSATQQSCTRDLAFQPTLTGALNGTLSLSAHWGALSNSTALRGTGLAPLPTLSVGYISNQIDVFDSISGERQRAITLQGQGALGVVVNQGQGRAYIAYHLSDSFNIVDLNSGGSSTPIALPAGSRPVGLSIDESRQLAYVSLWEHGELAVIDMDAQSVRGRLPVGAQPSGVLLSTDRDQAYVALTGEQAIAVVDVNGWQLSRRIELPFDPSTLVMDTTRGLIYVADARGRAVRIIDIATDTLRPEIIDVGQSPGGMALNADGSRLYVSSYGVDSVAMIDLATLAVTSRATVAKPTGVAVAGGTDGLVFVSGYLTHEVAVHRADTLELVRVERVSEGPAGFGLLSGASYRSAVACAMVPAGSPDPSAAVPMEKRP